MAAPCLGDSPCIQFTASGPGAIADLLIDPDPDNIIECGPNGLFGRQVGSVPSIGPDNVATATIGFSGPGVYTTGISIHPFLPLPGALAGYADGKSAIMGTVTLTPNTTVTIEYLASIDGGPLGPVASQVFAVGATTGFVTAGFTQVDNAIFLMGAVSRPWGHQGRATVQAGTAAIVWNTHRVNSMTHRS